VKALQLLSDDIAILEHFYSRMSIDVMSGSNSSGISFIAATFDVQLPVCLSGIGVLNYIADSRPDRALCLLAIIPEPGKTKIICGSADEHMDALKNLYRDESSPAVLEMLESWMCHGSDHWFMTPSEWDIISASRKKAACELILNSDLSIADKVDFSILDSARRVIIGFIEQSLDATAMSGQDTNMLETLLSYERGKFGDAPKSTDLR
jgi:hypothetical protein